MQATHLCSCRQAPAATAQHNRTRTSSLCSTVGMLSRTRSNNSSRMGCIHQPGQTGHVRSCCRDQTHTPLPVQALSTVQPTQPWSRRSLPLQPRASACRPWRPSPRAAKAARSRPTRPARRAAASGAAAVHGVRAGARLHRGQGRVSRLLLGGWQGWQQLLGRRRRRATSRQRACATSA